MSTFNKSIRRERGDVLKELPIHAKREVPDRESVAGISEHE